MLHILLMILKIIGIILLAIIGIALLIVILILFVPIRYRIQAHRYDDTMAKVNVSWLLSAIRFTLKYNGAEVDTKIRILGFDGSKFINGDTKQKQEDVIDYTNEEENTEPKMEPKACDTDVLDENKSDNVSNNTNGIDKSDDTNTDNGIDTKDGTNTDNGIDTKDSTNTDNGIDTKDSTNTDNDIDTEDGTNTDNDIDIEDGTNKDNGIDTEDSINQSDISSSKEQKKKNTRKPKNIFSRLVFKAKKIYHKFKTWCKKLMNMLKKADDIKTKLLALAEFIDSREFKDNFAFAKVQLGRLFKHIMPLKHRIKLEFGTGSPDTTGEILGALAVVMALTGMNIQVMPDFDNVIFRGEIYMKGRIRLFNILIIALKVYFNKELRRVADKLINRRF